MAPKTTCPTFAETPAEGFYSPSFPRPYALAESNFDKEHAKKQTPLNRSGAEVVMRVPSRMDRWPILIKLQSHLLAIRVNSEALYQSLNPDGLPLAVPASH